MRTKSFLLSAMIVAGIIAARPAQGQTVTYGSGAQSNTASPAAGTAGTNCVLFGSGAGASNNTNGSQNAFIGAGAGNGNTYAKDNVALGFDALRTQSYANGNSAWSTYNIAIGGKALYFTQPTSSTNGYLNVAVGYQAGYNNTIGHRNVFVGNWAGFENISGDRNTFLGYEAGYENLADENTFLGYISGVFNTTGTTNTYVGYESGYGNNTGSGNTIMGHQAGKGANGNNHNNNSFFGYQAGFAITNGASNTFVGKDAGVAHTSGSENVYVGVEAGSASTTATANTFVGLQAGDVTTTGGDNTFIGQTAGNTNTTGTRNTCLGATSDLNAGTRTNSTALGYGAVATADNACFIGNASLTSVNIVAGATYSGSDRRFKVNVKEDVKGLEFISKLRPVTYQMDTRKVQEFLTQNMDEREKAKYFEGVDFAPSSKIIHSGFIAQEVEQALKDCGLKSSIVRTPGDNEDYYSVNYAEFVVPLVKAVQEQQTQIETQQAEIAESKKAMETVLAEIAVLQNKLAKLTGEENSIGRTSGSSSEVPALGQNSPNPFRESTVIKYYIPQTAKRALIKVTNLEGVELKAYEITQRGNGELLIAGNTFASGTYTYSLIIDGNQADAKRMILSK